LPLVSWTVRGSSGLPLLPPALTDLGAN
jgi:hypothetical protein